MSRSTRRLSPAASRILEAVERPAVAGGAAVILLVGLPGTGKSTIAAALSSLTGAVVLESDRFRRLLFDAPVFSQRESGILFRALRTAAQALLQEGQGVIVDATNVSEADRRPFFELADSAGAALLVLSIEAPRAVVEERLRKRLLGPNGYASADTAVYHQMRGRVEAISRDHWRIDTSDAAAVEAALSALATLYGDVGGLPSRSARKGVRTK